MNRLPLHLAVLLAAATPLLHAAAPPTFETAVRPILANTCAACHNADLASGGLDLTPFQSSASLTTGRGQWETILQKLRGGEMPPPGIPRPPQASVDALIGYVQNTFEKANAAAKPDPGRVVARRLNRTEYSNTVRDLLGVNFRADKDFPTDDSSYGFDNIGEALTISPTLIEKYVSVAERIASSAIGADPLPKPITFEGRPSDRTLRRIWSSTSETTYRIETDAEYNIRVLITGNPPSTGPAPTFGFWVDGKLLASHPAGSGQGGGEHFEEARVYVEAGEHTFRVGLVGDKAPIAKGNNNAGGPPPVRNITPETILIAGPYASKFQRPSRAKILICDPASGALCVDRILTQLVHRAYRRAVSRTDVAALTRFYQLARQQGQTAEQGIQLAIQAMLVSPKFLFRVELEAPTGAIHRITDLDLASRLSYFLWSSMPDDRLLTLAEAGRLHFPATLNAEVGRLLADPRSSALAENFAGQWLEMRNLDVVRPDPQKFPKWSPDLRDAFRKETSLFFSHVLRENRPIGDFLDARYTFANELLAGHYGIPGVTGDDFRRVELTTDQRGGLLSQGSILTVSSYPTRTSVVLRGKYVLENILGTPPPPPPPDVPSLDDKSVGTTASLRQQMETHRASPVCASCHSKMDVLGFGLENYDAIGAWRTADGKFPVDSSGTLPTGKSFTTPAELRRLLMSSLPEFEHCLAEKMLTYALGRGLSPADRNTVLTIDRNVKQSDYRFQSMIREVVRSMPFQMQRSEVLDTTRAAPGATSAKPVASRPKIAVQQNAVRPKEVAAK